MSEIKLSAGEVDHLLTPVAIREKAKSAFEMSKAGLGHFAYDESKLKPTVDYVLKVIQENYPSGEIPFHSRWGHFRAGGVDRAAALKKKIYELERLERARVQLDLVITSVLLDAGAGADWRYDEDGQTYSRSEGLGVASFHMFMSGSMSSDGKSWRADEKGLKRVNSEDLKWHFQVTDENPLLGVDGRVGLLNSLATALGNREFFKDGRPGNILDYLIKRYGETIPATGILRAVLHGLGPIWPGRITANGINLGDVWQHSELGLVPLHKLSQWMTYSLIEPILESGCKVAGVEELTGLAEYRNGGLMLDMGLLTLRDSSEASKAWRPDSDLIIEWRALTVHLLDLIGAEVQKNLGKTSAEFPLAKVLEGGTWWAGRRLASQARANGDPPLKIESDGTVF